MTSKEAVAIVLDVGPSMTQAAPGECSSLQTSLDAINMILQRKLFSESKDEVALVLFGTTDTANDLATGDSGYENICLARPLGPVDWSVLKYVQNEVQPGTVSADVLDALVVAMDHIINAIQGKKGFGGKRVILLTDMGGEFDDDQFDNIVASMKAAQIEFNVIGPDLDDNGDNDDSDSDDGSGDAKPGPSNGHSRSKTNRGKPKSAQQLKGEALLKEMVSQVDGESYSFGQALPMLSFFQSRQVKAIAWKCPLQITPVLQIPICGYAKVKEAKPKTFKNVYAKNINAGVQRSRTHHLNDDAETEVDQSDVVDGLRYGSTLVPFSADDKEAMKMSTAKCLRVLGFTKTQNVPRHHLLGDSTMAVVADKTDETAKVALSAFIQALYETDTVMIVRRVYSNNSSVKLGVLTPHIKASYECLFYNEIPFTEDLRQFCFGSLPLTDDAASKKSAPSDEQLKLMDNLLEEMDLSVRDGDEGEKEALNPKLMFNPYLQRLYQCLQHRALNPDDPLPPLCPQVEACLKPPQEVVTRCTQTVCRLEAAFKLEQVGKDKDAVANIFAKDDGERGLGEPVTKRPRMDDTLVTGIADLVSDTVTKVGSARPIEDFKALINRQDEDHFEEACKMMHERIVQLVTDSFGRQAYDKALDCLKEAREAAVKNSEPGVFNDILRQLKTQLKTKGRTDFWEDIVEEKLGLIREAECGDSEVTDSQAEQFLTGGSPRKEAAQATQPMDDDLDDLLDCL